MTPSRQPLERMRSQLDESENYFLMPVYIQDLMVEAMANGVEDKLIDGLSFKLQPGASYVVDRRSVTYHPQGSNIYTPGAGTRLIRILDGPEHATHYVQHQKQWQRRSELEAYR